MEMKYSEGKDYKVIAFVMACFSNDEQQRIMRKVTHECGEHHCKVIFFSTVSDFCFNDLIDAGEKKIFDTISVERYDAIIIMADTFKQNDDQIIMIQRAHEAGVPVIAVDKYIKGCINLTFDYGDTFREIVKHMIEKHGYKIINFMSGMPGNSYSDERLQVFKEVLDENEITYNPNRVYYGYFWENPTLIAMDKMFEDDLPLPEAIICANDAMAITVCSYLQNKGLRVPEDIAVSGFDGIEMERYNRPRLTTGVYNIEKFVDIVFDLVENDFTGVKENTRIPVYNKMQIGHSCGCSCADTVNIGSEMLSLKANLQMQIKNQMILSQMVAKYGNAEHLSDVIKAIPEYMGPLRYCDFWFCANDNLLEESGIYSKPHLKEYMEDHPNYTKEMNVLHYQYVPHSPKIDYDRKIQFGEIIPDLDKELEKHDCLLILSVHVNGKAAGYATVSFNTDTFLYTAYVCFITNFRYLLEMQKAQMKMVQVYLCDSLTGLYNRMGFYQRVEDIMNAAKDQEMSVISLDMDALKKVNDTYGHGEGDAALRALGNIISESTKGELAARIGGDEFLIAFTGNKISKRTEEIVTNIKHGIVQYNKNSDKKYEIHASIGCYTDYIKGHTMDDFLSHVDHLMYARKAKHKREKGDKY